MTGEMEVILKLSDDELRQALGKSIFYQLKPTKNQIKSEFKGFKKIEVAATSPYGEKGKALIFVQDANFLLQGYVERDIIIVAEKGYSIDCKNYLFLISKPKTEEAIFSLLKESEAVETADLLDVNGDKFLYQPKPGNGQDFTINYDSEDSLALQTTGSYSEIKIGAKDSGPIPSTVKFGYSDQNHFMRLESRVGTIFRNRTQVNITCVPAKNIANLVGK